MAAAVLLFLVAQGADLDALKHPSRAVREEAILRLAEKGPPAAELAVLLGSGDARLAAGVAAILKERGDPAVLPALARHADHADAVRAEAAAPLLLDIAGRRRVLVRSLHFDGMELLPRRLAGAAETLVGQRFATSRWPGSIDRPEMYRVLYAWGPYAATPLRRLARDRTRPGPPRAQALHAYARLVGRAAAALLRELLLDPEPRVRDHAAALVWRYRDTEGIEALARLLESDRALRPVVRSYATAAAERLRRVGARGKARLLPVVAHGTTREAMAAVAALKTADPELAHRALRSRFKSFKVAPSEAGLFALRIALPEDLKKWVAASDDAVVAATVEPDRTRALALIAATGLWKPQRIEIISVLLVRHDAPWEARAEFAARALDSTHSAGRRQALRVLRGAPPEALAPLLPQILRAWGPSRGEAERLAAAALLAPRPRALRVCVDVLFDGDPVHAVRASDLLKKARPDLPAVDPRAPVAERRRLAVELGRRIGDKE